MNRTSETRQGEIPDLCRCHHCDSAFVLPVAWDEVGPASWSVTRRCPECETATTGTYDQRAVDRYDRRLDEGLAILLDAYYQMVQANMSEYLHRFRCALANDHILPEDF